MANCGNLRTLFHDLVRERRKANKERPEENKDDLISILLSDELFCNDDEMIVDECLTFFFAGTQTSSMATSNLVLNLLKNTHYGDKIR